MVSKELMNELMNPHTVTFLADLIIDWLDYFFITDFKKKNGVATASAVPQQHWMSHILCASRANHHLCLHYYK
jgi:hypothetical protein